MDEREFDWTIADNRLVPVRQVTFSDLDLTEAHLEELLERNAEVFLPGILLIGRQVGPFGDGHERVDLLGVQSDGSVVVIEVGRELPRRFKALQGVQYSTYLEGLTFDEACQLLRRYQAARGIAGDPRARLLDHLGWEQVDGSVFGRRVAVVYVMPRYSATFLTAVLRLNARAEGRAHHITCVQLRVGSYSGGTVRLTMRQLVPATPLEPLPLRLALDGDATPAPRGTRRRPESHLWRVELGDGSVLDDVPLRRVALAMVHAVVQSGATVADVQRLWSRTMPGQLFVSAPGWVCDLQLLDLIAPPGQRRRTERRRRRRRRYFVRREEVLYEAASDTTYALTTEWRLGEHRAFLRALIRHFPQAIRAFTMTSYSRTAATERRLDR